MVAHVAERALEAKKLDRVIIAIDTEETKNALSNYEFELVMTKPSHNSGTDRIAEVVRSVEDAEKLFASGADKISINSKAIIEPEIIDL